jgi:hypothetical protein
MCWNANVSLTTFIVGVIVNTIILLAAIKYNYKSLLLLCIIWYWVFMMQFCEFFIWKNIYPEFFSKLAYVFNVTQILLLAVLFLLFGENISQTNKILAGTILVCYLCIILFPTSNRLVVEEKNKHLSYPWWDSSVKVWAYIIAIFSISLLLIKPFYYGLACGTLIFLLLFFSMLFYRKNVPSIWCFFACFFPIAALVFAILIIK